LKDSLKFCEVLERIFCAVALVLLSPILLAISMAILLDTRWPILFAQARVGRHAAMFRLFKFRTMRQGTAGPCITAGGDRRITRTGALLRKFKLDELPQLWNVVCGNMSLVGPRPEVPDFVDYDQPVWRSVLQVRPGITDPASIAYYREEELLAKASDPIACYREVILPAKLALNVAYQEKRTIWSDIQVILTTLWCAFFRSELKTSSDVAVQQVTSK
jgi:lipopolysaccharide/colanic/teichoic acid biosynthesis glycosyltransferase